MELNEEEQMAVIMVKIKKYEKEFHGKLEGIGGRAESPMELAEVFESLSIFLDNFKFKREQQ